MHNLHSWVMFCMCFQISHRDRSCICKNIHASAGFSKTKAGAVLPDPTQYLPEAFREQSFLRYLIPQAYATLCQDAFCKTIRAIGRLWKWRWMKYFVFLLPLATQN